MKIALLFPDYGSQFVGMGKELYDESRIIQEYFEQASNCLDQNFVKLCFASSDAELSKMNNAYTAIFLVSSSIYGLLADLGLKPDVIAGFNLGEYAALYAAGALSLPDGLYLLNKLAHFYQEELENVDISLLEVSGIATQRIEEICKKASKKNSTVFIGAYISSTKHILGGHADAVERVREVVSQEKNITCKDKDEAFGLHSKLMQAVVDKFRIYLEKVDCKDITVPLIGNVSADIIESGMEIKDEIIEHSFYPVLWSETIEKLQDCDLFIEIGPGTYLTELIKEQYPTKQTIAINKKVDIEELKIILGPERLKVSKKETKEKEETPEDGSAATDVSSPEQKELSS